MEYTIQRSRGQKRKVDERENDNSDYRDESTFDFKEQSWRTDFVIIVEGTELHVAKIILSLASPVFDRMFQSGFKECKSGKLKMPTKTLEEVKLFLRCIYPNTVAPVSCDTALKILPLVEEYQVDTLKATCEKSILDAIDEETTTEMLYRILREATIYTLNDVREKCLGLVSKKPMAEAANAHRKYPLPAEIANDVLTLKIAALEKSKKELQNHVTYLEEKLQMKTLDVNAYKEYFAKYLLNSQHLLLNSELKWKENEVLMKMDTTGDYIIQIIREVFVWDVKLSVTATCNEQWSPRNQRLSAEIKQLGSHLITADIKVMIILLNRKSKSESVSHLAEEKLSPNNRTVNIKEVAKFSEIKDQKNGFIHDGNIWLLAQVFMSEPKMH